MVMVHPHGLGYTAETTDSHFYTLVFVWIKQIRYNMLISEL